MGLYTFNPEDAYRFAQVVHIQAKPKGNELWFKYCPFCHGTGKANEKKFSINLDNGMFKCFRSSCGRTGNMLDLEREFDDFSLGHEVDEYYSPKKKYRTFTTPKEPIKPKPKAVEYLLSRGISEAVTEKYEITVRNDQPNVLAFTFYDENGKRVFVKYRKTDYDKDKDSSKEWCEKDAKPILFGMKQCEKSDTLIITEGQLDSLSLVQAGFNNAVSVPMGVNNLNWVPYCWNWVNQFDKILVFGDHEKGHITLLDDIRKRFKKVILQIREEDYRDCKDANDILRKYGEQYLRDCVNRAIPVKINNLVDISDVEDRNDYDTEALRTGIKQLDDCLLGGFRFPGMVIITGKRGEGKSTLASQIMGEAVEQGYKTMIYSGEMSATRVKSELIKQLAGKHCFKFQTKYGYEGYEVSKTNKALINAWISGSVYLYDNNTIGEGKDLLGTMEDAITQYGVRVILLDNLMTAIAMTNVAKDSKFDAQGDFTQKVAALANKHNVIIFLVAHKRKNATDDEMDDISGASEIANLAIGAISYSRDKELDGSQRMLRLLKDRTFGRFNIKGWIMYFDEKSNRIYGEGDDVNKEYGWFIPVTDFQTSEIPDEIPFE